MRLIEVQEPALRVGDTLGEGTPIGRGESEDCTDGNSASLGHHPTDFVLGGHRRQESPLLPSWVDQSHFSQFSVQDLGNCMYGQRRWG